MLPLLLLFALPQTGTAGLAEEVRAWIETGEPVASRFQAIGDAESLTLARAVDTAARFPADWKDVLFRTAAGTALALRFAHEGLPPDADWETLLSKLESWPDRHLASLVACAALVPSRVSDVPSPPAELRDRATALALGFLLSGKAERDGSVLFQRLRGVLRKTEAARLASSLMAGNLGPRNRAASLLGLVPFSVAENRLQPLILDPDLGIDDRLLLLPRFLEGRGRSAWTGLWKGLATPGNEILLRRLMVLWEPFVEPEDLPALAAIADKGLVFGSRQALQIWARREENPGKRLEIFQGIEQGDPNTRIPLLASLARQGPHADIAERLLSDLDSSREERRQEALAMLPRFAKPDWLTREFLKRIPDGASLEERARWIPALAELPVAEARQVAAAWLAEGGWIFPGDGFRVARLLRRSGEIDPFLPELLWNEEVPEDLRFQLAVGRAAENPDARDFLRRSLDRVAGFRRERVIRALAAAGDPGDRRLLLDLARDPGFEPAARAAALDGLAADPAGLPLLELLLDDPPRDYEVAEALVRALIVSGRSPARARVLEAVRGGLGFAEAADRRALQRAAWAAQEDFPQESEAPALAEQLGGLLEEAARGTQPDEEGPSGPLPDPRSMGIRHPDLTACAAALAACARTSPPELARFRVQPVPAEALLQTGQMLAEKLPRAVLPWVKEIAAREDVDPGTRVRALGLAVRCARLAGLPGEEAAALNALLARPWELRNHPWDLDHGLHAGARGWVLPADRLAERRVLAESVLLSDAERLEHLKDLLTGFTDVEVLLDAADLAGATKGGTALRVSFARRAVDWEPGRPGSWLELGRAQEAAGDLDGARQTYASALERSLRSSEERRRAEEALTRLGR